MSSMKSFFVYIRAHIKRTYEKHSRRSFINTKIAFSASKNKIK